jgi:catechol 2,3-dioxygenase-like lactoylglutathione lyase family enzyme
LFVGLAVPQRCFGYGLFTHQQLIDLAWDDAIQPLLLSRFPKTSAAELRLAHAYAYGGCVIQDMGYYPFGHDFFSDLTHYVRSGDFVLSLFRHARDVNEYAFAVGALSHYVGDSIGHHEAVNPATAQDFPKLEKKYGSVVTYQDSPKAHVRTEFGFDIDQLSARRFAPQRYLDVIGFRVADRLLRVAFWETYGLELREVLGPEFPAMRSYRSSVRRFIPLFAYAEVVIHKHHFQQDVPNQEFATYMQRLRQIDYGKRFANAYRNPGIGAHLIAVLIPILPRIGPLAYLAIKDPKAETEQLYVTSVNRSVDFYRRRLGEFRGDLTASVDLPNRDLDTGEVVRPGAYRLTDQTYARLLQRITARPERAVRAGIKRDILAYYADPNAPIVTKRHKRAWKRVLAGLQELKRMPVATPFSSEERALIDSGPQ